MRRDRIGSPSVRRPGEPSGRGAAPAALDLLRLACRGVAEAAATDAPADRFVQAHLAALRASAAVLAARTRPVSAVRPRRPTSAWVLLAEVAPELAEWAAFFAAGARKRAAAEAGLTHTVSAREADDLVRDTETFLSLVQTTLGVAPERLLVAGSA